MSDHRQRRAHAAPDAQKPQGAVTRLMTSVAGLVAALLIAMGISSLIECVGIAAGWWPKDHARGLLTTERGYIEAIDQYPLTSLSPVAVSERCAREFDRVWQGAWSGASLGTYTVAVINTVKLVFLRIAITLFTVPGFFIVALVAGCDGLVARDVRKFTGGHESSYIFHKAKRWIVPSLMLTVSVYLMLPISLPPVVVFSPTMVFAGVMVYVAASRFKKFL